MDSMRRPKALTAVQKPNLLPKRLAEIAKNFPEDAEIMCHVMRHPNAPPEILQKINCAYLVDIKALGDWLQNPSLPLIFLADSHFIMGIPRYTLREILRLPSVPTWLMAFLQACTESDIAESASFHVQIHPEMGSEWVDEFKKYLLVRTTEKCEKPKGRCPAKYGIPNLKHQPSQEWWSYKFQMEKHDWMQKVRQYPMPLWVHEVIRPQRNACNIHSDNNQMMLYFPSSNLKLATYCREGTALYGFMDFTCPYCPRFNYKPDICWEEYTWQDRLLAVFHPDITTETLKEMKEDGNVFVRAAVRDKLAGVDIVGLFWDT
jgi:hypothetical protein